MEECIQTGARVYFPNYGTIAPADIYAVGEARVIRFNPQGWHFADPTQETVTHTVFLDGLNFWRHELGIAVVHRDYLARGFDPAVK